MPRRMVLSDPSAARTHGLAQRRVAGSDGRARAMDTSQEVGRASKVGLRTRLAGVIAMVGVALTWGSSFASAAGGMPRHDGGVIATCSDSTLKASVPSGPMPENTAVVYYVTLSNRGPAPCSLPKWPARVVLLGQNGDILPIASFHNQAVSGVRPLRVLAPRGRDSALAIVSWSNWCGGPELITGFQVRLRAGNVGNDAELPTSAAHLVPGCDSDNPTEWTVADSGVETSNFIEFRPPA
jgi:hypothetical protein